MQLCLQTRSRTSACRPRPTPFIPCQQPRQMAGYRTAHVSPSQYLSQGAGLHRCCLHRRRASRRRLRHRSRLTLPTGADAIPAQVNSSIDGELAASPGACQLQRTHATAQATSRPKPVSGRRSAVVEVVRAKHHARHACAAPRRCQLDRALQAARRPHLRAQEGSRRDTGQRHVQQVRADPDLLPRLHCVAS